MTADLPPLKGWVKTYKYEKAGEEDFHPQPTGAYFATRWLEAKNLGGHL